MDKSSSDSELAKRTGRRSKVTEKLWHLLDVLTVDGLAKYRRRRLQNHPKDSVKSSLQGDNASLVSEYRRSYCTTDDADKDVKTNLFKIIISVKNIK